jgi:Arylsulfotransferase (ASST)
MRNTWAAYLVNGKTGQIEWTLGGRHSSFELGPNAGFQWQHDVVLHPGSLVTMFDDHCCQITGGGTYVTPTGATRALVLKLDPNSHTATLARQYGHGANFAVDYMGSSQPLPGGGAFVGWGSKPNFSEYDASGKVLFDVVLPGPDISYRARREAWIGLPLYPPVAAARRKAGKITVYASWNGATQVVSWRVLGRAAAGKPVPLATADRSGFETSISVPPGYRDFEVQGLDSAGRVLGTSRPFRASS